jgi:hypothetical protein
VVEHATLAAIRVVRRDVPDLPAIRIDVAHGRELSTGWPSERLLARATLEAGGQARARGYVDPGGGWVAGRLKAEKVALPPLAPVLAEQIRVADGELAAVVDVAGPPLVIGHGDVAVDRFGSESPRADGGADPVLAWHRLDARVERAQLAPLDVRLRRLAVAWPYLVLRRDERGLYPRYLLDGGAAAAGPPPHVAVASLALRDGTVFFEDRIVEARYLGSIADLQAELAQLATPPFAVGELRTTGMLNEVSPIRVEGRIDAAGVRLDVEAERLALVPLNGYLTPLTGYVARDGGATVRSEIRLRPDELDAATRLTLSRLDLGQAGEEDLIGSLVGVPFTLAVALMKDYRGRIDLTLPIHGDPSAPGFAVGGVVLRALRDALLGALQSPVRLIGSVLVRDDKIAEIRVEPVPFPPGMARPDARGEAQLDRVAVVLSQAPELAVTLRGQSGPEDPATAREALAQARAAWARSRLLERHGIARARVALGPAGEGLAAAVLVDLAPARGRR